MKQIRAFIGHSFVEEDSNLISRFTKFFDQLAQLDSDFGWVHAEAAEPKELAAKVLALFLDRNLFIGICTRKERVVAPAALRTSWWLPGRLWGREEVYEWKTSDWIIQEIGMAKGRNADVLLLLEDGVRMPGGLLGSLEYIVFDRASPEKIFGKIVEMITALSPKPALSTTDDATSSAPASQTRATPAVSGTEGRNPPTNDWKRLDYDREMMMAIGFNDVERTKVINDAFLASDFGSSADARSGWAAHLEYRRIWWEKGGELSKLKRLAEEHQTNSEVLYYLARAYAFYDEHAEAAAVYGRAADVATDITEQGRNLRRAATEYQKAGLSGAVAAVLRKLKTLETDDAEVQVLLAQKEIAEVVKNPDAFIGALERLLEIDPSDKELRFALAYKYANLGQGSIALAHYSSIKPGERDGVTWNNLGVAFEGVELRVSAVSAYRESESLGETLAMSNLANRLLGAGFVAEAEAICSRATSKPDYHKNVARTISRLKEVRDEEQRKMEEALDEGKPMREFYRRFGRAMSLLEPTGVSGRWKGPNGDLDLVSTDLAFAATGEYQVSRLGGLGQALLSIDGGADSFTTFKVRYAGKFIGCAVVATVARAKEGQKRSLLDADDNENKVLMVLSADQKVLHAMEITAKDRPRFYEIIRAL